MSGIPTTDTVTADGEHSPSSLCVVVSSAAGVAVHPLDGRATIGRDPEAATIFVPDKSVSRQHAAIVLEGGTTIADLDSHNGTFVLGRRLAPNVAVPLPVGASVRLGNATMMLVPAHLVPQPAPPASPGVVVADERFAKVFALLDVVAPTKLSVLVLGETGTGKEILAEELHARSPRARRPFVVVNCAALAGSLLESELFGHDRGAFTGADVAREGIFEAADGGTLFLDEIGDMPIDTQAKLLRVLETGEVVRLGSRRSRTVDVRLVSATNHDLQARIRARSFREDLYFRIGGVTLLVPPLRERLADIGPLAVHFTEAAAARTGRAPPALPAATIRALEAHPWPGNVRELRAVIERTVALHPNRTRIDAAHVAFDVDRVDPPAKEGLRDAVGSYEKDRLLAALSTTRGNRTEAAKLLGVSRRTLTNRLRAHGIGRRRSPKA